MLNQERHSPMAESVQPAFLDSWLLQQGMQVTLQDVVFPQGVAVPCVEHVPDFTLANLLSEIPGHVSIYADFPNGIACLGCLLASFPR